MIKKFVKSFLQCGFLGWSPEILFTALGSLRRRNMQLKGNTSLWMFPIYGSLCVITPLFKLLGKFPVFFRGTVYALCIFTGEYFTGSLLARHSLCPWNYERSRWNIRKVIRLDYFPNWFLAGLLFERLLSSDRKTCAAGQTTRKAV